MIDSNNKQKRISFEDGIVDALKKILEKTKDRQPLFGQIMMGVVKDLVLGQIQEKDAPALLQNKLNISQIDAQNLFNDLKTQIIPLIYIVPEEEEPEEIKPTAIAEEPISKFAQARPAISVEENEKILGRTREPMGAKISGDIQQSMPSDTVAKKIKRTSLPEESKIPAPAKPRVRSGPDRYREPIE